MDDQTKRTDAGGIRTLTTRKRARGALRIAAVGILFGMCTTALHAQMPPEKVALVGGRIIPVVGEEIESGTVLIERGRIVAVGEDVEIPYDAMEVDVSGKVLMPGMINAHAWQGLDVANETLPVAPFLDVYDAIDPSRSFFEDSLRDGVTTVHAIVANNTVIGGVSRAVRPIGLTVDEMTVTPEVALKISASPKSGFDRMKQQSTFRETFAELDDYLLKLAERKYEEKLEKEEKEIEVGPAEARKRGHELVTPQDYDDKHRNLVRLREGDLAAWCYVGFATDVAPAVALAEEQGYLENMVMVLGQDAHRAIGEIKKSNCSVVLPNNLTFRDRDSRTGKIEETFIPSVFYDAGVPFALLPNPGASLAERYLSYQAALCVRNGIPRTEALKAITINPATMLGLGDRLGSIEEGKIANIVILSGDPLDFSSWVEQVYIDGVLAYDRTEDPRLKNLLEIEAWNQEQAEKAETEAAATPDDSGDVPEEPTDDDSEAADDESNETGNEGDAGDDDGEGDE